jgi:hypothetical protein
MFRRKPKPPPEPLPEPPTHFPDGRPFPGQQHLGTIERVGFAVVSSRRPRWKDAAFLILGSHHLVRDPYDVDLLESPNLFSNLMWAVTWLRENGMVIESREYHAVLTDLGPFWEAPDGPMGRLRRRYAELAAEGALEAGLPRPPGWTPPADPLHAPTPPTPET